MLRILIQLCGQFSLWSLHHNGINLGKLHVVKLKNSGICDRRTCSAVSREDLKKRMMDPVGPNTVFLPFLVYHCVSFL